MFTGKKKHIRNEIVLLLLMLWEWSTPKKVPIVGWLGFHLTSPSTAGARRKMISICGVSPTFPNVESDNEHQNPLSKRLSFLTIL